MALSLGFQDEVLEIRYSAPGIGFGDPWGFGCRARQTEYRGRINSYVC